MDTRNLTPLLRKYLALKRDLPEGTLLLLRLGDFYELFMDDARRAAPLLGLTISHRAGQPMCGIPHHAIDIFLEKIVRCGFGAAIAEGVETWPRKNAPIRYEVTRIVTPGTEDAARRERELRRARLDAEKSRAERYGYDTETCLANAAECGGL